MELKKGHIAFGAACLIAGIVLGAGFRSCGNPAKPVPADPIVIHDTVTVTDTFRIKGKTKTIAVHDTVWIAKKDTNSKDEEPQMLVHETKLYRDTFTTDSSFIALGVKYSGYNANIDNIDMQYRFNVQPRTIEKKRGWGQFIGIGIGVGYGASVVGQTVYAAPEVGIHITYGWGYHW